MFRSKETKSPLNVNNFGAGSILKFEKHRYLLICERSTIRLVDLNTMELLPGQVLVQDPNHITYDEVDAICGLTGLCATRSDFDFISKGLK